MCDVAEGETCWQKEKPWHVMTPISVWFLMLLKRPDIHQCRAMKR